MGDFNAHLGALGGERGVGDPNQQGLLLHQLLTRCNLYVVSLSLLATGPQYTFQNSVTQTTVDYILASQDASHYIQQCFTHMPAALNCSDHLSITMMLRLPHTTIGTPDLLPKKRVNWSKASKSKQLLHEYQMHVSSIVQPLIGHSYGCCEDIDKEISFVSDEICSAAERILPLCQTAVRKKEWQKDQTLSRLAAQKKAAWDKWSANGRPKEGTLYEAKIRTRADFRKRLRVCVANSERRRIQHFDKQFKQRSSNRFKLPSRRKQQGTALRVNQQVTTEQGTILKAWESHFQEISSLNTDQTSEMTCTDREIEQLLHASFENVDNILDVTFEPEEVDAVLRKLKCGKTAGHDGVQAEHLKYGGPILRDWILHVCNAISVLEEVPVFLKMGIITPVYKGGGKDPLDTNNYRGVTVTSVLAKVLESLLLPRLQCHLANRGIPHTNQTAYHTGVSCAEAIFSTLEVLSTYSNKNEKMHMCFYDLQKAFDSIQYPILTGVDGRVWRLLNFLREIGAIYGTASEEVRQGQRLSNTHVTTRIPKPHTTRVLFMCVGMPGT